MKKHYLIALASICISSLAFDGHRHEYTPIEHKKENDYEQMTKQQILKADDSHILSDSRIAKISRRIESSAQILDAQIAEVTRRIRAFKKTDGYIRLKTWKNDLKVLKKQRTPSNLIMCVLKSFDVTHLQATKATNN